MTIYRFDQCFEYNVCTLYTYILFLDDIYIHCRDDFIKYQYYLDSEIEEFYKKYAILVDDIENKFKKKILRYIWSELR